MSLTSYVANKLAEHLYRNVNYPSPQIWVGLHRDNGSELDGAVQTGYARVRLDDKMATPVDAGVCVSNADLAFPVSTSTWGSVAKVGLWEGETTGELLQVIDLDAPLEVGSNTIVRFPAGTISLGFNVPA
jgi:hypothetical protein